ncbi:MAG: hypothetical protein AB2A00_16075 [Myxococcota bacterium]
MHTSNSLFALTDNTVLRIDDGSVAWSTPVAGAEVLLAADDGTLSVIGQGFVRVDGGAEEGRTVVTRLHTDGQVLEQIEVQPSWRLTVSHATAGPDGDIYIAGTAHQGFPLANVVGSADALAARLSPDGTMLWVRTLPSEGYESADGITTGPDGSIYLAFGAVGSLPPPGHSGQDAFVVRLSPDGAEEWITSLATYEHEYPHSVHVGNDGRVYVATQTILRDYWGEEKEAVTLHQLSDDGQVLWSDLVMWRGDIFMGAFVVRDSVLSAAATGDLMLMSHQLDGSRRYERHSGGPGSERARALVVDQDGHFYLGGFTWEDQRIAFVTACRGPF